MNSRIITNNRLYSTNCDCVNTLVIPNTFFYVNNVEWAAELSFTSRPTLHSNDETLKLVSILSYIIHDMSTTLVCVRIWNSYQIRFQWHIKSVENGGVLFIKEGLYLCHDLASHGDLVSLAQRLQEERYEPYGDRDSISGPSQDQRNDQEKIHNAPLFIVE